MKNFYEYDYLLIDKVGDFHYFKNMKKISEYLDMKPPVVHNIIYQCKRNYNEYHSTTGLYIQRLYNNTNSRQPKDPEFIWDKQLRKNYLNQKIYNIYKLW
tara:strand:- start:257 stop:556 length:300 start_codon:yes stop_codon:yes gene_type:complete